MRHRLSDCLLCGGLNQPHLCSGRGLNPLGFPSGDRLRLDPLEFQLLLLQGAYQVLDCSDAVGRFRFVGRAKLIIAIGLKFVRSFPEHAFDAFAELQFGFAPGGIAIGESFSAEIVDRREDFLKLAGPGFDFFERDRFGRKLRVVCCACTCHSGVGKV